MTLAHMKLLAERPLSFFEGHGLDAVRGRRLAEVARWIVERQGAAPCAALAAARRGGGQWLVATAAVGRLWRDPAAPHASLATPFDLASLTKPLTALVLARLERAGRVSRESVVGRLVPELADTPTGRCSLDLLAAHRAGLDGHRALFVAQRDAAQLSPAELLAAAAAARRVAGPTSAAPGPPLGGYPPEYSDLGYLLLGAALERQTGATLEQLVAAEVSEPLGLALGSARQWVEALGGRDRFVEVVAPTEVVEWRGGMLRGVVHDENAWVLAGDGIAGHAGAFGDVGSVLRLGMALLDGLAGAREQWLTASELREPIRPRPGGSLCAGFDRRSGATPSSGRRFGPETFGHLGFTGTSLWIDPEAELVGVLLTNRVCPTREDQAIRRVRPVAYDALYEVMTSP